MKKIFLVLTVMSLLVSCGGNSTEATSEATSESTTSDSTSVEATSNEVKK